VAEAQAELAAVLGHQGKYEEAKPLYLQAIKTLGQDPIPAENGLETVLSNYHGVLRAESERNAAAKAGPVALPPGTGNQTSGVSPSGPPAGPGLPILDRNLYDALWQANKARNAGKMNDAEQLFQRAVADAEKLPPQDPRLATTLVQFAGFYEFQSRPPDAEPLLLRALVVPDQRAGPNSPEAADVLVTLTQHYTFVQNNPKLRLPPARRKAISGSLRPRGREGHGQRPHSGLRLFRRDVILTARPVRIRINLNALRQELAPQEERPRYIGALPYFEPPQGLYLMARAMGQWPRRPAAPRFGSDRQTRL
jgi:tetratricopeptide (TPR) repeat protein